ncbi:hypothetical protein L6164_031908 [Bauhinia variegata]|uniref:Uncharacterized protein n=1 Tax=Bauhinia variegata TaxID=167791 RepID=A0ACB9KMG7_BAUVA|nr:hypothetical protein L6164_031908 [Bauhinia variegata]
MNKNIISNHNNMLHCLNTSGNLSGNCSNMTALERQRARTKMQQDQQHLQLQQQQQQNQQIHQSYFYGTAFNSVFSPLQLQLENSQGLIMAAGGTHSSLDEIVAQAPSLKPEPGLANGWPELGKFDMPAVGFGSSGVDVNSAISRTYSCPPSVAVKAVADGKGKDPIISMNSASGGRENFNKRKAEKTQNLKVVAENNNHKDKKIKVCAEEGESKITEQTSTKKTTTTANNNSKETSADTSKENSKASEVQKPDYIHVRARRGQATDSHSLAERVRREKISERMKYLQDLVPGCNKITGKAGMLDEIINYVQSLQRQVEFLSMKLAVVNPGLDFNTDDLFAKDVFPACGPSYPTIGLSSAEMTNPAYLQFNSAQQIISCCGLEMGINPPDTGLRRAISAPVSFPETFLDSTGFTQVVPPTTAWETDLQNLYNVAFDQARSTSYPSQQFTAGPMEARILKMEM